MKIPNTITCSINCAPGLIHKNVYLTGDLFIETPVKLTNVKILKNAKIGAFSYLSNNTILNNIESIGRYCSIASNVIMWNRKHDLSCLSTNPIFKNLNCNWTYPFSGYNNHLNWFSEIKKKSKKLSTPPPTHTRKFKFNKSR